MEQQPKKITRRRVKPEERAKFTEQATKLYLEENKTLSEIGEQLGFASTTISSWFKDAGVPIRPRDGGKGKSRIDPKLIDQIRFLMEHTDLRDHEIIAAVGLKIRDLRYHRQYYGLPEVSSSEQARRAAETRYGKRKAPDLKNIEGKAVNQHGLRE
jgi:transposase-like protein